MDMRSLHQSLGATLADDGIPLHYGNLHREYHAALQTSVLLDRSHEGRLQLYGTARFEFLNRMSTNKIVDMAPDECRPTIFTNATARILDRVTVCNRPDYLLLITDPGRGSVVLNLLQRQIFFNDDVQIRDVSQATAQFSTHGIHALQAIQKLQPEAAKIAVFRTTELPCDNATIFAVHNKPYLGSHWTLICDRSNAAQVYKAVLNAGQEAGLVPAGSLLFNLLRIRAGHPGRPELTTDYIPLELGLWDEVHFAKGCYTGQEIIARMESRAKLAKTLVALQMERFVNAPAEIRDLNGSLVGNLTSSVQAPDGHIFTMAVIKTALANPGTELLVGTDRIPARVDRLLGEQPDFIQKAR